jgi:uncharacterized protein YjlB
LLEKTEFPVTEYYRAQTATTITITRKMFQGKEWGKLATESWQEEKFETEREENAG